MKKNKKAFTLIEIIVAVVLITVISAGSVASVTYFNNKKKQETLSNMSDDIRLAANVYIETNEETKKQLYEKNNGVVIPLVTLENEGLIDFKGLNVDDEYVVTLLSEEEDCMAPSVIESWDFSEGKTLYVCTKIDNAEQLNEMNAKIEELVKQLTAIKEENQANADETNALINKLKEELNAKKLEELATTAKNYLNNNNKGASAKNWVKFDVTSDTTKWVWWPNDTDKNLWHIHSIDDSGRIRLVYNKPVGTNNAKNIQAGTTLSSNGYYKLIHNDVNHGEYNLYENNTIWTYRSVVNEDVNTEGSRKQILYNNITNKNWIVSANYYPHYNAQVPPTLNYGAASYKMGMLSSVDVTNSISGGTSWIGTYEFMLGTYTYLNDTDDTYVVYINSYNINKETAVTKYSSSTKMFYQSHGSNYIPVITLDSKVKIANYENCVNGKVRGTKDCPYELYKSA